HPGLHDHVAPVDPGVFGHALLSETGDAITVENDIAEAGQRRHGRHGRELSLAPVESHEPVQWDVRYAITIGQHEGCTFDERRKAPQASSGQRIEPSIDEMDLPGFLVVPAPLHDAGAEIDREVARHVSKLQKKVLHHLGLVTERYHKLFEAVGGIELHDVP